MATVALAVNLLVAPLSGYRCAVTMTAVSWALVAVVCTAGTALGNALAENDALKSGLPIVTLISAGAFGGVLLLWWSPGRDRYKLIRHSLVT